MEFSFTSVNRILLLITIKQQVGHAGCKKYVTLKKIVPQDQHLQWQRNVV